MAASLLSAIGMPLAGDARLMPRYDKPARISYRTSACGPMARRPPVRSVTGGWPGRQPARSTPTPGYPPSSEPSPHAAPNGPATRPHPAHEQATGPAGRTGRPRPAGIRVHLRSGRAGRAGTGWSRLRAQGRRLVHPGGRRRRVHVASAALCRAGGGLFYPRAARLASPVASRASGPAGAGRLYSGGDAAQRRCLTSPPVAGRRLPGLAVLPDARSGPRDVADARTAPVRQLPMAGRGHRDPAARPDRERSQGQHPGCRAGELARRLAPAARTAPVRGAVLAGPPWAPALPPGLLRPVRLLRVPAVRGGLPAGAGAARHAAARGVLRRADARWTVHPRPAARRPAARPGVHVRV